MKSLFRSLRSLFFKSYKDVEVSWPRIYLSEPIIDKTAYLIASYGRGDQIHEGIAYWAGVASESNWVVTTVLAPEAKTTIGSYNTSVVANAKVVAEVNRFHLHILAQVHGHPSDWVDHSKGDDTGAFMPYNGYYSIVVPWYGRQGLRPLSRCGIHRYQDGRFVRLLTDEISSQFIILPSSVDLRRSSKGDY